MKKCLNYGKVKSRGTRPEKAVRKILRALHVKYRLNVSGMPGTPDIVIDTHRTVVFVHGCFWHGHGCANFAMPVVNRAEWSRNIDTNIKRDARACLALRKAGWMILIVWECEVSQSPELVAARLSKILGMDRDPRKKLPERWGKKTWSMRRI